MEKVINYLENILQSNEELKSQNSDLDIRLRRIEAQQTIVRPLADKKERQSLQETEDEERPVKRRPAVDDHRTAPHKLILLWPSVGPLLADAGVTVNDGYVMEAEDRGVLRFCLLYTSPSPRDGLLSRMPSSA